MYRLSAIRQISGFRTASDEAVLVSAKTMPIDILADKLSPARVSGANSDYKSGETKDFHAQMAVIVREQFKGKMDISPCP